MGQMYMDVPQPDTNTTGLGAAFFALPLNCGRSASETSARGPNMWYAYLTVPGRAGGVGIQRGGSGFSPSSSLQVLKDEGGPNLW